MSRPVSMNAAIAIHRGSLLGVVPKTYLPNYREFYERQHFRRIQQASPKGAGQESGAKSFKGGVNDFGRIGYDGPCSPRRHG
jgi:predicted amidohydrolase